MVFIKIVLLLAVLLILFAIYEIIGLFRKRALTHYVGDDGRIHRFGDAVFSVGADSYLFHDNRQPAANRYQGNSNVEQGLALINLRDNPSATDLTVAVHKEGWVDLAGNIYGASGLRLGYITDLHGQRSINGSGRWYELWLRKHSYVFSCPPLASEDGDSTAATDTLVGKVVETGRIGRAKHGQYTTTARAGGFLLLYRERQAAPPSEDAMRDRTTWKDTALPAAVAFVFIYLVAYLTGIGHTTFPALGQQIGFTAALLLVYFAVWAILRQVKLEAQLEGRSFDDFLMLINRNTGVGGLNNWIILLASAALVVSIFIYGSDFIPLQAAILIGAWVNRKYITREPWELADTEEEEQRLPDWTDDNGSDDGNGDNDNILPPNESDSRTYHWQLDSPFHTLTGELTLQFNPERIATLRAANPFRLYPNMDFKHNIEQLMESCRDNRKVHQVLSYIEVEARRAGLNEMERMQFILDFVQRPNIEYEYDEKCEEIGCPRDYARYPDETMYDGRGDCDCKAALAAILFREAGHKTAYLTTINHAAVAVAFRTKVDASMVELAEESMLTHDGYMYFFCETTGDGFRIGDLGSTTKEAITDILFLN